ncbi:purine-nucleoside phosphorylase [Nocardioides sp. WL0053]|uniref:Uridine phosphorylase n=1 Tax=Nocardioides jiangsuensis TaxID=2866161 RepID=A0ABS7RK75_9ACTN|nr:purine-nucleoside phosphorylase [Nocardioides jiangsuensis]MBY9075454.1 purine-nucleoside phosphorylase [Nocardioides jiangsuensis]
MSTHIAAKPGQIAPYVLMPGDPLRAKWIAETFLEDTEVYSEVRGMLGFTGTYRGERVSVQGSGMGLPSFSIYAHELFAEYDVQAVVRVGSCGALSEDLAVRDIVIASGACTDSSMNRIRFEGLDYAPVADFGLLRAAVEAAEEMDLPVQTKVGLIMSSDSFYSARPELVTRMADYGVLAVEMEAAALYTLAAKFKRRGLTICTVSDHILTGEETTSQEREKTFGHMVEVALDAMLAQR